VAEACGLEQLVPGERNALLTTTFGVGELVRAALDAGARHLVIGLGGTATNDAGAGLLSALGARFLDSSGADLAHGGAALIHLAEVELDGLDPRLRDCQIELACDVSNPLLGQAGASAVFGPQKGAGPQEVALLDQALTRWADVVEAAPGVSVRERAGSGAGGGLGAAFLATTSAELVPGIELVMRSVQFAEQLVGADYVFTGEGSVDAQSRAGKVPLGVAAAASAQDVPTVVFGGRVEDALADKSNSPVLAYVPIVREISDLTTALHDGPKNLQLAAAMACQLLVAPKDRKGRAIAEQVPDTIVTLHIYPAVNRPRREARGSDPLRTERRQQQRGTWGSGSHASSRFIALAGAPTRRSQGASGSPVVPDSDSNRVPDSSTGPISPRSPASAVLRPRPRKAAGDRQLRPELRPHPTNSPGGEFRRSVYPSQLAEDTRFELVRA